MEEVSNIQYSSKRVFKKQELYKFKKLLDKWLKLDQRIEILSHEKVVNYMKSIV